MVNVNRVAFAVVLIEIMLPIDDAWDLDNGRSLCLVVIGGRRDQQGFAKLRLVHAESIDLSDATS